jgi:hypothetical protein
LSQEGYAAAIVEELGLSNANKSPMMTPFHSGLPVDTIPHIDMTPEERAPLIAKMQSWMGMINWLQQCIRPDLATIFSLLASHMHCPSLSHLEAAKYIGCYIHSTLDLGLLFSIRATSVLETFIHFPLPDTSNLSTSFMITIFCDTNWGPQDASHPSPHTNPPVSVHESKSTILQSRCKNQNPYVEIYFCMEVLPSFGKLTRNLASVDHPVKQR